MRHIIAALTVGLVFGAGLVVSDMVNPARVLAFLDVSGEWDPTLAYVLGAALVPSAIGYLASRRMGRPIFHTAFHIPDNRVIDRRLVAGATLFGAGWGLVGYCPGPALAGLAFGTWETLVFVAAMLVGMWLHGMSDAILLRFRPDPISR